MIFSNAFLFNAFLAAILASFASGMIGSYVVTKRVVFLSGSIAHSVLGMMGFFVYLERVYAFSWATPLLGALLGSILSSLIIGFVSLRFQERQDALIASVWSIGMATGVLFLSATPGYNTDLLNFLFGNLLWTTQSDLWILFALDIALFFTISAFYRPFLVICFDERQARLKGLRTEFWYLFLLVLIGISIVLLIQVMGIVLVMALLSLPAMLASLFTRTFFAMMLVSSLCALACSTLGIVASYELNFPTGSTIALVTAIAYTTGLFLQRKVFSKKTNN
ncbi:MAG: metal ABC transporter permease [Chlamydiota bacterium]